MTPISMIVPPETENAITAYGRPRNAQPAIAGREGQQIQEMEKLRQSA